MEAHRKNCFEQLRHKNACSIDELKSRLRRLYVQDIKTKRDKALKDKRDIILTEEDDLDFFKKYCLNFFGPGEDPWDLDEDLLLEIWEEIKLEDLENAEANIMESLLGSANSQQIVCPVCLRLPAQLHDGHLTCKCGLKFPLPNNITLQDFETTLLTSNELHSAGCSSTPFYVVRTTKDNCLQFTSNCETCETINIILEAHP